MQRSSAASADVIASSYAFKSAGDGLGGIGRGSLHARSFARQSVSFCLASLRHCSIRYFRRGFSRSRMVWLPCSSRLYWRVKFPLVSTFVTGLFWVYAYAEGIQASV